MKTTQLQLASYALDQLEPEDIELLSLLGEFDSDYKLQLSALDTQALQAKALKDKKLAIVLDKIGPGEDNTKTLQLLLRLDRVFGKLLDTMPRLIRLVATGVQRGTIRGVTTNDGSAISEAVSSGFTYGCNTIIPLGLGSVGNLCGKLGNSFGQLVEAVVIND